MAYYGPCQCDCKTDVEPLPPDDKDEPIICDQRNECQQVALAIIFENNVSYPHGFQLLNPDLYDTYINN